MPLGLLVLTCIAIFIFLAINYPGRRLTLGITSIIIGNIFIFLLRPFASMSPLFDFIVYMFSLIVGFSLMVWGTLTRRRERIVKLRICPRCGRDLSRIPTDIKKCPYCGGDLY